MVVDVSNTEAVLFWVSLFRHENVAIKILQ